MKTANFMSNYNRLLANVTFRSDSLYIVS